MVAVSVMVAAMTVAVAMAALAKALVGSGGNGGRGCGSSGSRSHGGGRGDDGGVVFRKEWFRKTGKEVIEGRLLLHRLLGFKGRCKGCLQLIIMSYSKPKK